MLLHVVGAAAGCAIRKSVVGALVYQDEQRKPYRRYECLVVLKLISQRWPTLRQRTCVPIKARFAPPLQTMCLAGAAIAG